MRSVNNWKLSALRFSGRFNVIFAVPESYASSRVSKSMVGKQTGDYTAGTLIPSSSMLGRPFLMACESWEGLHQLPPDHIQRLL